MKKKIIFILLLLFVPVIKTKAIDISYRTHVQNYGWQPYTSNDEMNGTSGKSLRLEAINIKIDNSEYEGNIEYRTHVQNYGWQPYVSNDEMSGTSGKSLRLEAIEIRLTGELAKHYSVFYSVHVQNKGWRPYVKDGELAGTTGQSLRLEAIKIKLVSKDTYDVKVNYASANSDNWGNYVNDGEISGTTGQSLSLNQVKIKLNNNSVLSGDINYQTYSFFNEWTNVSTSDVVSGDNKNNIEAIKISLTGELAEKFNVFYRVHVSYVGWMGWTSNGAVSGTIGYFKNIEAIEVRLLLKEDTSLTNQDNSFKEYKNSIEYTSHVSYVGWQNYVSDGELSGTTGQSKRLEAYKIKLNTTLSGNIIYKSYIAKRGWSGESKNDELSGTTGLSRNLEAISVKLTGDIANYYDVYYRTHSSYVGWLSWAKNGAYEGSIDSSTNIEAIEIKLIKKGTNPNLVMSKPFVQGRWENNKYYDYFNRMAKGFKLIDGVKYYFNPNGVLYGKNVNKVIDVSSWQGDIDWDAIKREEDVDAAIIRVGWGTSYNDPCGLDSKFDRNIKAVQRLGIPYSIYIYAYAETKAAAEKEADFMISKMKQYNMPSSTFVWYDAEEYGISKSTYNTVIPAFANRMKASGYRNVGVYGGVRQLDTTNGNLNSSTIRSYPIWVSQYYTDLQYTGNYVGWQYASDEQIYGIVGNTDVSMFKK